MLTTDDTAFTPCYPTCPGWGHFRTDRGDEVERCDDCARFPDDDSAQVAHDLTCACNLNERTRKLSTRPRDTAPMMMDADGYALVVRVSGRRSDADDDARYQCEGSPVLYTLAEMIDANADTPDVTSAIRALAPGEKASFGGGGWAESWVRRVR